MYLLDTNIASFIVSNPIFAENIKQNIIRAGILNGKESLFYSVVSYQENLFGIEDAKMKFGKEFKKERFKNQIEFIENELSIVYYSKEMAKKFVDIKMKTTKQGFNIPSFDLMIAATAIELEYILITNNVKDFKNIPGLQFEDWTVI